MATGGSTLRHSIGDHWHYFEAAQRLNDMTEAAALTDRFSRALGFETHGFAHKALTAPGHSRDSLRTFHNYRNEFGQWYRRLHEPGGPESDARVIQARSGLPAAAWNVRGDFNYAPRSSMPALFARARRQAQLAGDFNMRGGITIPSMSRGTEWCFMTLSTNSTQDLRELAECIGTALYFAHCLQVSVDRLAHKAAAPVSLTPREAEILRWTALGKTSWEISNILRISERTVNFHLQSAARRLGVQGRRAACARAIALGLVSI